MLITLSFFFLGIINEMWISTFKSRIPHCKIFYNYLQLLNYNYNFSVINTNIFNFAYLILQIFYIKRFHTYLISQTFQKNLAKLSTQAI